MQLRALKALFKESYGYEKRTRVFFAPGRVNLIGEHTDYNGGYVFPAALTFGTWAIASPREDHFYRFTSANYPFSMEFSSLDKLVSEERDGWAAYPKGVLMELIEMFPNTIFKGADVLFYGNIPNGAGLSSSASIELVTGLAISKLIGLEIPIIELVGLGQRAENRFVGVNCGIMDQFAVGMGKKGHALLLKCDTLEYEYVPVEINGYKLVITNTNVRRELANSKYNERRMECEKGLSIIQKHLPAIRCLGDVNDEDWGKVKNFIEDEVIRRRVEHVISENMRVLAATNSLRKNELTAFGEAMKKSHQSLRDLYEVTGSQLDILFEEAVNMEGCVGSRMTGAGFGGCTVSLVKEEKLDAFMDVIQQNYKARTGLDPIFYVCEIGDGAKEI